MLPWSTCTFVNARVMTPEGEASSIRFRRRVIALDERPHGGDTVVDLDGRLVIPGLVNAHDHLELNHYGELKVREQYGNAREWISDLGPVIRSPEVRARSRKSLADRLFIGGLKNLLSGVTTVAHHNPLYRAFGLQFPVRVVDRFGWAHSLSMESGPVGAHGEPGGLVAERSASTPSDQPFIVHAAEGVDRVAAAELETLEASGSLRANSVLVHGVAIPPDRWADLFARGVSLVWCPRSNRFLFGRTLDVPTLLTRPESRGRICLGTDSRVTGSRDLLGELRVAADEGVGAADLLAMVTTWAANVLRLDDAGRLHVGDPADLVVLPASDAVAADALLRCQRADLSLIVRRGTPLVGEPALASAFAGRCVHTRHVEVDGAPRLAQAALVRRIERCTIQEAGVCPVPRPTSRIWLGSAASS